MPRIDARFPATDRKVLRRLDEAALRQAALGIIATLLSYVAIVAVSDLWQDWPRLTVVIGGLLLLVSLAQGLLILGFDSLYPRGPRRWRRLLVITLVLRAAVWSAFVIALMETRAVSDFFYLAMFLPLALGAALAATWLADDRTPPIYLLVSLVPPALDLVFRRGPDGMLVAIFLAVFFYALLRVSSHHYRMFWRLLARVDSQAQQLPVMTGSVPARLLVRTAEEFRLPVATVSDVLTLVGENRHDAAMLAAARRSAQQMVARLELLTEASVLLRGEREPQLVAGSLRRRCEENADDIGVVGADTGVLVTTIYEPGLPARLRTDYPLFFRALRGVSIWLLEQMPVGSELVLRFQIARSLQQDRLRCLFDPGTLFYSAELRSGLARAAQADGSGLLDSVVPWPLAISGEQARLLGGRLALVDTAQGDALALEIGLDVVDKDESGDEIPEVLLGQSVLLAGFGETLAAALTEELSAAGLKALTVAYPDLVAAVRERPPRILLLDARDPAVLVAAVRGLRQAVSLSGVKLATVAQGAEAPSLPDDVQKLVADWLRLPCGRRRLRQYLSRIGGGEDRRPGEPSAVAALRVLLVDDNPVNQMVGRGLLEKIGCEVELLADGAEAVERLARGGIDLVLMDAEMPGMNGSEATRRVREREITEGLPRLPIVAMTAHTSDEDVAGFLAAGMDDCIAKPVSLANLAARIERYRQRG